jgi:DNA-binding LacI/PurR family transcriptional regulator
MKNSSPTMRDVARAAGVSIQTVSAIINAKPGITAETTERVLKVIQELGYRPFSIARSLRTRQTHTIGLVVPDIANPAFSALASTVEDAVHALGYNLVVYNTHNDPQRELSCIQAITQRWIDGVLFVSTGNERSGLDALNAAHIPVVAVDRIPADYGGPAVVLDNIKAGYLAARHLLGLGHVRIAHIRGPGQLRLAGERQAGFHQALREAGVNALCPESEARSWACESGYECMRTILSCSPEVTAVFAASDRLAIGAMRAILESGRSVPGDISVAGVDDIEVAAYQNPPMTSVRQSFGELGQKSVAMLLAQIQGTAQDPELALIVPRLVARQSTAQPK